MALEFMIIGSSAKDVYVKGSNGSYQITLFGATADGTSVSLSITGYQPFFFVEIPDMWSTQDRAAYQTFLLTHVKYRAGVTMTFERHKSYWDFSNNRLFTFLKIKTNTKKTWTTLRNVCLNEDTSLPIPYKDQHLRVFEANIDPILRFFHIREIKPAGWIHIDEDAWSDSENSSTTTSIQCIADMDDVHPAPPIVQLSVAPLRILSWDIECTSSHGDFPLAIKTWRKPARELVETELYRCASWDEIRTALQTAIMSSPEDIGVLSKIYLTDENACVACKTLSECTQIPWSHAGDDNSLIDTIEETFNTLLPAPNGDPIIQIGSVLYVNGKAVQKDIYVLGTCDVLTKTEEYPTITHPCKTESSVIRLWCKLIETLDPDIMVGYNIFGFDNKYLWDRATVTGVTDQLSVLSRSTDRDVTLKLKNLCSSAMGDNSFQIFTTEGRLHIDLLAYVRRNAVLESYSLDSVTATFMSGGIQSVTSSTDGTMTIKTKSTKGTDMGCYIVLLDEENDVIGEKLEVLAVDGVSLTVRDGEGHGQKPLQEVIPSGQKPVRWSQAKDDISPQEIFKLHRHGDSAGRAKIAKYCIQDCDLVMELMQKLEVINNSIAMANVCWVPVDYIFTRGQGIKSESLVFYECRNEGQLIPVLPAPRQSRQGNEFDEDTIIMDDDKEGYEGAIVLDPLTGIYTSDDPVAVLDFSSLYPSTEISENMSHDSVVSVKDYDCKGNFVCIKEGSDKYDNLPEFDYLDVPYDIFKPDQKDTRKHPALIKTGVRICRFVQSKNPLEKSTLPKILQKLLSKRKATRKLAESESDDFRRAILDATQLAYKLTANSLYGQLGSNTSKIRRKCLAASTTAHGRRQLLCSKECIEQVYGPGAGDPRCAAICVYGDTDSLFIAFRPKNELTGEQLSGHAAQVASKLLAEEAGQRISGALKAPHDFEFDKMFKSFCLLSKKRYVGDMTEGGLEASDYHRKSMGIVMKRRDNAAIVKYVYGGVIEHILTNNDIVSAFQFVRKSIMELLANKFPLKRLTITKSLRAEYKLVPAHKILANRIAHRDPGNRLASNDRIPFVYVMMPNGKPWSVNTCQGDRIETPTYLKEMNLKPDYVFYITNQIAKPVAQVFGLVVEKLPGIKLHTLNTVNSAKKRIEAREELACEMLFGDLIRDAQRTASGQQDLRSFFKRA